MASPIALALALLYWVFGFASGALLIWLSFWMEGKRNGGESKDE